MQMLGRGSESESESGRGRGSGSGWWEMLSKLSTRVGLSDWQSYRAAEAQRPPRMYKERNAQGTASRSSNS